MEPAQLGSPLRRGESSREISSSPLLPFTAQRLDALDRQSSGYVAESIYPGVGLFQLVLTEEHYRGGRDLVKPGDRILYQRGDHVSLGDLVRLLRRTHIGALRPLIGYVVVDPPPTRRVSP